MNVRTTESRGHRISYEDAGEGPAIVLVNGMASPAAEWRDRGYVDRLVGEFRVVSVDSLGHGQSATPHEWEAYRAPAIATDIVAAMDAAGVERAALWGYSRGGWLTAVVAAEYPHRVATLIAGGWANSAARPGDVDEVPPRTQALIDGDWVAFWEALPVEVSAEDRRYMEDSSDPKALGAVDLGTRRSQYVIDLGHVRAPVFLYYASEDAADPEFAAAISSTATAFGIEPHILEGNHDHFSAFENSDAVLPPVLAHLRSIGEF
jgi:pimeloyl-ACP methyl ester carboxylesterase